MNQERLTLLKEGKVSTVLLKLGLPAIIGMMTSALYNIMDAYFVGALGASEMGAVTVVFPLMQVIIGIGLLFGSGAGSYISRLLGEGDNDRANHTASTAVFTSLVIGLIVIGAILIFLDPVLKALGATPTILPFARSYALIFISGGVLQIFNVTMNNIAISEGAAKITMKAMLLSVGLNTILDPLFIYYFNLGVAGAAIATVIAQAIATLFFLWYIVGKKSFLRIAPSLYRFDSLIYKQIFKIGAPILLLQLASGASMALTNMAARHYGDSSVAAMGVVARICTLGAYVVFGYVKGFQPLAGYSYGAKNFVRLNESVRISLIWTTAYCALVSLLMIILAKPVVALFGKSDTTLIQVGSAALRANGIIFITFGFQMVYSTLFLALGKAKEGGILSLSRQGIFFIPVILTLPALVGLNGIIYTQLIADVLTVVLTGFFAYRLHKELKYEQETVLEQNYKCSQVV